MIVLPLLMPGTALADQPSAGGAAPPERPTVSAAVCASGEDWGCRREQELKLSGTA